MLVFRFNYNFKEITLGGVRSSRQCEISAIKNSQSSQKL